MITLIYFNNTNFRVRITRIKASNMTDIILKEESYQLIGIYGNTWGTWNGI